MCISITLAERGSLCSAPAVNAAASSSLNIPMPCIALGVSDAPHTQQTATQPHAADSNAAREQRTAPSQRTPGVCGRGFGHRPRAPRHPLGCAPPGRGRSASKRPGCHATASPASALEASGPGQRERALVSRRASPAPLSSLAPFRAEEQQLEQHCRRSSGREASDSGGSGRSEEKER
eukprot:CAMPEP_0177727338 /NCGR_PEP_ID=MMETSP0484_2-20121128/20267_1 /TAXON_ID=354590 /ORGANISM="Rhodomonas lens, Strain RHODO" /LENGTH=177 /DNA_ID=CAMNT_0019239983 /DNA_START=686 /DNA_END=1215 /DNA_ORIENTATION=-